MRILVTGSSGHLGEGLVRTLRDRGDDVVGLDLLPGPGTDLVGSITDPSLVAAAMAGVDGVLHPATLHKPHVGTHTRQDFVDTNVTGTLTVLEAAATAGVCGVVLTSTTSAFGRALSPAPGEPAAWITEDVVPVPKNVYGVTKVAGEDLAQLVHADTGLPVVVLRTSRFFPEGDDDEAARTSYPDANLKVNELLHRRLDLADAVSAHLAALDRAPDLGFARYVVSATTPFVPADRTRLPTAAADVVRALFPQVDAVYDGLGWALPASLDRVYVNDRARRDLGWEPRHTFGWALAELAAGRPATSELARAVGAKGYHAEPTGPYTLAAKVPPTTLGAEGDPPPNRASAPE